MTNKGPAQGSAITEDDQLVILAVGVSLLVVVMAVIVGSFLFLLRRRRTPCWRGRLFSRPKPERVLTVNAREARLSYPTWPCNHVVTKGRCRLPQSDQYASPPLHRERSEAKFSPCVALPSSTSEQPTRSVLGDGQAGCISMTSQASTLHQRPLSSIYRTYSPSSLSWASHQSCWNTDKQTELCGPNVSCHPSAKLGQAALGIIPFLMNSWPRHPSHHSSAEVMSNPQQTTDREQAKAGNTNVESEVSARALVASGSVRPTVRSAAYIRQMSFPPASAGPAALQSPLSAPRSPLSAPRVGAALATAEQQMYDRADLFRTIQLLRAKNDWVRHTRLARLRFPRDCFGSSSSRPPRSDAATQGIAGRPMHGRCFSEPSASFNGARQCPIAPAIAVSGAASQPPRADSPDAKARTTDRRRLSQRTTRALAANAQRAAAAAQVCAGRPARGGTVVYPRRVSRPSVSKAAPASCSRGREAAISSCGGRGDAPLAARHARSTSSSGGDASAPIGRNAGEPTRSMPQLLDALKLRPCDMPRPSDDELLSSEPPSLCDVSLNSSLTPELSTARDRRRPPNDAGGSTSVDDKYEFDLRTPG